MRAITGCVVAAALVASLTIPCAVAQSPAAPIDPAVYVRAATEAAMWIRTHQVETARGLAWPASPEGDDRIVRNLYHGTPGVILFFIEMARATGDQSYLEEAAMGADDLASHLEDLVASEGMGFYVGIAGAGYTLNETFKITQLARHRDAASRCVGIIQREWDARRNASDAGAGGEVTDIIAGYAGTGLFLLYALNEWQDERALPLARQLGDRLLELGVSRGEGTMWPMATGARNTYPNFSHGTAGVAYFLASLGAATKDTKYTDAAIRGAKYLISIADTANDHCLIPRFDPSEYGEGEARLFYLGWCHGPAGTGRFFHQLYKVTGDGQWRTWRDRCGKALLDAGIPEQRPEGFWNNSGVCCGNAGVAHFALAMYRETEDPAYLDLCKRLTADLMARSRVDPDLGTRKWVNAEHRAQPENVQPQTGLMQGAAGIGLWLLKWRSFLVKRPFGLRLPDDPFE